MQGGDRQTEVDGRGQEEDEIRGQTQEKKMEKDRGGPGKQVKDKGKENGGGKRKQKPQLAYHNGAGLSGEEGESESSSVQGPGNLVERGGKGNKKDRNTRTVNEVEKGEEKGKNQKPLRAPEGQRARPQAGTGRRKPRDRWISALPCQRERRGKG